MKNTFPNYKQTGTAVIEQRLPPDELKLLVAFLTYCRTTANEYKVTCRKSEILQVRDIIEKPFPTWTLEDLRGFLAVLNQDQRAIWTKKCILTTFQLFLKWHWKDWSSRFNNLDELRKLNRQLKPNNSRRYNEATLPTATEIDALIRTADSVRDKLYVSMAAEAGLPPIVQLGIRWRDIRLDSPQKDITTLEYFRTKNQEGFIFPFGKIVTYYLKQWAQEYPHPDRRADDLVFPSPRDRQKSLSSQTAWYMLKRLARRAGIQKNVYQYLLRHKTLSEAYTKVTEEVHRKLFGHVRGSVQTRTYSHSTKERALQIALEKLHQVEEIPVAQRNQYEQRIADLETSLRTHRVESIQKLLQLEQQSVEFAKLKVVLLRDFPGVREALEKMKIEERHSREV